MGHEQKSAKTFDSYLSDETFLRRLLAFAEKIWNETNLQEVAQDWMF